MRWALIAAVISVIAGIFRCSGVSSATAGIAKVLFGIATALFLMFGAPAFFAGQAIF